MCVCVCVLSGDLRTNRGRGWCTHYRAHSIDRFAENLSIIIRLLVLSLPLCLVLCVLLFLLPFCSTGLLSDVANLMLPFGVCFFGVFLEWWKYKDGHMRTLVMIYAIVRTPVCQVWHFIVDASRSSNGGKDGKERKKKHIHTTKHTHVRGLRNFGAHSATSANFG